MIDIKNIIPTCKSLIHIDGVLPEKFLGFCNDTRVYNHPSFFVAYQGAKHNPLEHIEGIIEKGCRVVVYEKNEKNTNLVIDYKKKYPDVCFVSVVDSIVFTQELSSIHISNWQRRGGYLFAISGSNGKTTHKEMLSFILNNVFPGQIESTQKNNNNHLGVPFTLLQVKPQTRACVLELGSNHPGEIKVLCDIANPRGGLVTNIGATHLEFFYNEENVFKEEAYLHAHLFQTKPEGLLFFQNIDDSYLKQLAPMPGLKSFSVNNPDANYFFEIRPPQILIKANEGNFKITNHNIAGTHNFSNLATAFIIAINLFPDKKNEIIDSCSHFKPTFNRSQWQNILGKETFLDAYNANPSSMKIALTGFFDELTRRNVEEEKAVLFLGDMNELGQNSDMYHQELGQFLKKWPRAKIVFVGRFASHYMIGRGEGISFANIAEVTGDKWREITRNATHVFIKGSRSLQLESLLAIT